MSGWIRVERSLMNDHPFFDREPMSEREAWLWMIAKASWDDTRHKVGREMFDVPRGSFMVTLREMQSVFMWRSDTKVRNFLKRLQGEGMIERTAVGSRNAPKTHITICNYNKYQSSERTENAPKTHRERTKNAVKKQINNKQTTSNEVVGDILSAIAGPEISQAFILHRKELKKPLTENGANAISKKLEGHHDPGAVLTDSIANGWQGVFPDKIKPQFKAINGGHNGQRNRNSPDAGMVQDAAIEQIARLARLR
jgi:hypothetical protein